MIALTASSPAEVKILEQREDGSGIVEVPILSVGTLDLGGQALEITDETMDELVANFAQYPGPVPLGVSPHVDYGERSGPQPGFMERVYRRAGQLWARMDLSARLFGSLVRERAWRGFSVEMIRNLQHPSRKFSGWVLVGGVFTNRPASDVVFRVAAEADPADVTSVFTSLGETETKEHSMEPKVIGLEVHEAKVAELSAKVTNAEQRANGLEQRVTALEASNRTLTESKAALEADLSKARNDATVATARANTADAQVKALNADKAALAVRLTEAETRLKAVEGEQLAEKVKLAIEEAMDSGLPPALFDGYAADPAAWLNARFANFEAFSAHLTTLRAVAPKVPLKSDPVKSGADKRAETTDRSDVALSDDEKKAIPKTSFSLGATFVGALTEAEAKAALEAAKAAKN